MTTISETPSPRRPSPSRPVARGLRRAGNILTPKGKLVPAIQQSILDLNSFGGESSSSTSSDIGVVVVVEKQRRFSDGSYRNTLASTFRKKFQEVKDASISTIARTRSLSFKAAPGLRGRNEGLPLSRSSSDLHRPKVVHANSAPETSLSIGLMATSVPSPHAHASLLSNLYHHHNHHHHPVEEEEDPSSSNKSKMDIVVPLLLQQGTPMTKVSSKKQSRSVFRLDPDQGQIRWESKRRGIVPIENIKEIRSRADARYYREQFQLSVEYEDRWLTIIYILDGQYKTLHLIAATNDVFQMWDGTLRKLHGVRQELMSGLGNIEMREAVWEKQYWKGADGDGEEKDQKLEFEEVEKLCKRLNIRSSRENLLRLFKQSDSNGDGCLDFPDFRRFVKLLKGRPDLDQLYKKLAAGNNALFDFKVFEGFMRDSQKSTLSQEELKRLFVKYASVGSPSSPPASPPNPSPSAVPKPTPTPVPATTAPAHASTTAPPPSVAPAPPAHPETSPPSQPEPTSMSLEGFTAFILSTDNSAFSDQHGKVWHDMTRPMSEYYISSSHNTYLVGHQLVGVSTIEGYIRALLHSCRSVELDIYDGDTEPMIFHGKTFTSKVSLREVCQAISKYAFVSSPYPVIISAEIHCGLVQQDMLAKIMHDVFGDTLISAPIDGRKKIEVLPSPEELKGKVLLKAKNLYVSEHERMRDSDITVDTDSTSTSDSDAVTETKSKRESGAISELKHEFAKARSVMDRVRHRKSPSSPAILLHVQAPPPAPAPAPPPTSAAVATTPTIKKLPASKKVPSNAEEAARPKIKMSVAVAALLVYTVGVKCRGINKKEEYAVEHVFSLSEKTANKILKESMIDLIKHSRTHLVRTYPKGLRLSSTNYEPHRYWSAGAQLVAINWQTCDLGYMINHSMFQRNGRSGYVLKPVALRLPDKDLLTKRTKHFLDITIISAQQLPRPKDASGREVIGRSVIDPYIEVSIHVPDWTHSPFLPTPPNNSTTYSPASGPTATSSTSARTVSYKTSVVKNNGFNPVWHEKFSLPFDCVGTMKDLVFVKFAVHQEDGDDGDAIAVYCASLGSLQHGFRHLPLHDSQMSQYLFSTLFVNIGIRDV